MPESAKTGHNAVSAPLLAPRARLHHLIAELAATHFVYAEYAGQWSCLTRCLAQPEITNYAASHLEALKAMGIDKTLLLGTHTGASIAAQLGNFQIIRPACTCTG